MNRLLPILVLFSLIFAGSSSALPIDWPGMDQFQRGNRITPTHMNDIIDALDSIKLEVDPIIAGGGDAIYVNGVVIDEGDETPTFDLRDGNGISIVDDRVGDHGGTFNIQLYTGSGLIADGTGLSLRRDCTSNYVLQWSGTEWLCAEMTAGGGGADMTVNGSGVVTNFLDGVDTGSTLYVDFLAAGSDVTGSIDMTAITDLGTIATATTINNQLTLSSVDAEILFNSTGTASCGVGQGSIYWDGAGGEMMKCEDGTEVGIAGTDIVDPIQIDSNAVTDSAGVNFLGGDGVTVTHAGGVSPDTATVAVDLNATIDGDGSTSNLSGLEFTATNELALLQGCADNQVLAWNDTAGTWGCAAAGAGGTAISVNGSGTVTNLAGSPSIDITDQGGNSYQFTVDGTAINELGTLTTQIVTDELGVRFTEEGTEFTDCTTDFSTSGGIFYDDNVLKKCENGTLTDLAPDVNNITGNFDVSTGDVTIDRDLKINGTVTGDIGRLSINGGSNEFLLVLESAEGVDPGSTMFQMQDYVGNGIIRMFKGGNIHAQGISDIDGPGTNWSIAEDGTTDLGNTTVGGNLITTGDTDTDTLGVGAATTTSGKAEIGGEADAVQLVVQGHSTQTNDIVLVENDGGTDLLTLDNLGVLDVQSIQDIDGPGTNWSIAATGAADFTNTTVDDLTSAGTLAHSGGTATLSSGATDTVALGDVVEPLAGKVEIGGTQDQPQLVIEGHSTQTDSIIVVQDDADTEVFNVNNDGLVFAQSIQDMERCQDEYNIPLAGGGEQTTGIPDGVCDLTDVDRGITGGTTLQTGAWGITENGRASFSDIAFNSCVDDYNGPGTAVPQTTGYPDGLCDADRITPSTGRLTFNVPGFDGTIDYDPADGSGAGNNVGGVENSDSYISTQCIPGDGQLPFVQETGCDMTLAVGRRAGFQYAPHIILTDTVTLPDFPSEADVTQIQIGAPIVPLTTSGSTAAIAMGGSTISGAIDVTNISGGQEVQITQMVNVWFFVNSTGTISLQTADQVGRSACFYAAGSHQVTIETENNGTGSDIILNGVTYAAGASTSPRITSSGSLGDFVCLLSANPDDLGDPAWYVLGQSGTWTGAAGS